MTDLPAILSGVAVALTGITFWLSAKGLSLREEYKEDHRSINKCMDVYTSNLAGLGREVSDLKQATNEATGKTAETVSRLVADITHLKQDVAKLHNTSRSIPDNELPGVPRSSPFRRP